MLSEKSSPQVNLIIPPVVDRLISIGVLRAVAIKHLVELSIEHEFVCHFFLREKLSCYINDTKKKSKQCLTDNTQKILVKLSRKCHNHEA